MIANTIARMIAEVIVLAKADFQRIYRIPIAKRIAKQIAKLIAQPIATLSDSSRDSLSDSRYDSP